MLFALMQLHHVEHAWPYLNTSVAWLTGSSVTHKGLACVHTAEARHTCSNVAESFHPRYEHTSMQATDRQAGKCLW